MTETAETTAVRTATVADQVALVDADAVAAQIASAGPRFAIQASTIEVMAMAVLIGRLRRIADLTYDMLAFADLVQAQKERDARAAMRRELSNQIAVIGASLEALGYGETTAPQQETLNGQG